jgi:N-acetylglutamate synthase-like GNAT family acetyltransferase
MAMFQVSIKDVPEIAKLADTSICYVSERLPTFCIVRADDKIIGCVNYELYYDTKESWAEINHLIILPEYRKQGYAHFLIMEVAKEIGKYQVKMIRPTVFLSGLIPEFFIKYGFTKNQYEMLEKRVK